MTCLSICCVPGVLLSLRVLHGGLAQLRRDSPLLLKHAAVTRKLGFPDVIMPGDVRYGSRILDRVGVATEYSGLLSEKWRMRTYNNGV